MVEIVKCSLDEPASPGLLGKIAGIKRSGGTFVYPTKTLYGIGASIFSDEGITAVFQAKDRPEGMPLSVFAERKKVTEICDIPVLARPFLDSGLPITIILPAKWNVPANITQDGNLAVRIPDNPLLESIVEKVGPITGTSANKHLGEDPTNVRIAMEELGNAPSLYIDAGPCEIGLQTTIVEVTDSETKILREGAVSLEELLDLYGM